MYFKVGFIGGILIMLGVIGILIFVGIFLFLLVFGFVCGGVFGGVVVFYDKIKKGI